MSFYRVKFLFKVGLSDFASLSLLNVYTCIIWRAQILEFCLLSVSSLKKTFS